MGHLAERKVRLNHQCVSQNTESRILEQLGPAEAWRPLRGPHVRPNRYITDIDKH